MNTTKQNPATRPVSFVCKQHPEWGVWSVTEDKGGYFEIRGRSGVRMLDKDEAKNILAHRLLNNNEHKTMRPDTLQGAATFAASTRRLIRDAHSEAIAANNNCAEMLIFQLIDKSCSLEREIQQIVEAIKADNEWRAE